MLTLQSNGSLACALTEKKIQHILYKFGLLTKKNRKIKEKNGSKDTDLRNVVQKVLFEKKQKLNKTKKQ